MYAVYSYIAGATAANILADVVKLLTGTTNVADLSASCNQARSLIIATEVAGWTVYDAAAGVNAVCLRAPVYDNPSQYKYIVIDTNTAGDIYTKVYEAWNATTHTGTNLATTSGTAGYCQRVYTTGGGRLDIRATIRCCFLFSTYVHSTSGLIIGAANTTGPSGITEFIRTADWNTKSSGYPNFVFIGISTQTGQFGAYAPRSVWTTAQSDSTTSTATFESFGTYAETVNTLIHSFGSGVTEYIPMTADRSYRLPLFRLGIGNVRADVGGDITELCEIYYTTYGKGFIFNQIYVGSQRYIVWQSSSYKFAIKYA